MKGAARDVLPLFNSAGASFLLGFTHLVVLAANTSKTQLNNI